MQDQTWPNNAKNGGEELEGGVKNHGKTTTVLISFLGFVLGVPRGVTWWLWKVSITLELGFRSGFHFFLILHFFKRR